MAFHLYSNNKLEYLADKLMEELARPQAKTKSSLFQREVIVSQSKGMEKWLSLYIADKTGISANIKFPFPKKFIYDELFSAILDLPEKPVSFQPETMAWKIMGVLPGLISKDKSGDFDGPKSYLSGSKDASGKSDNKLKLYQLSNKIANVFDQYMVYRPGMIQGGWKNDGYGKALDSSKAKWQKILFEKISEGTEKSIPSKLCFDFIARLNPDGSKDFNSVTFPELPPRIFVFGVSVMPPLFLDVFNALSNKIDVHFFYMNPCIHYWADLESEESAIRKNLKKGNPEKDQHYDINPLLASMGKYGKDFHAVVTEELGDFEEDISDPSDEASDDPSDNIDLLSILQNNIRTLATPPALNEKTRINIQFHSCYNPMREVEVLYDNLLSIIETDKIDPKDILVVTPDIGKYAPFVRAVFETPEKPNAPGAPQKFIPYSIADRTMSSESPVFKAFIGILEITKNRYAATAVMDILDTDGVRENFKLGSSEISELRTWLSDCRISWGIDAEYRKSIDLPAFEEGSWRAGLDRLLLGFALGTEENDESFKLQTKSDKEGKRIFPYEKVEEGDAIALGRLAEFADKIFEFGLKLSTERTLSEWRDFLTSLIETFMKSRPDNKKQIFLLKQYVNRLGKIQDTCGYDEKLPLDVVKSYLVEHFEQEKTEGGFMRCGVTFCELLPMRSIPFKVICMLGMNDNDFPRQTKRPGFDLTLDNYRKCDRELRYEDKYLFLEAILSAREYLYVSYTGMSMDDNKKLPPSVLVSDLKDYLMNKLGCTKKEKDENNIFTEHPLQTFSYRNYLKNRNPKIFSYSKNNYDAAVELLKSGDRKSVHVFWPCDLKIPLMEESKFLRLETLNSFFKNPAKHFLRARLNLRLEGDDDAQLDEKELFELNHLEIYNMNQEIMAARISKDDTTALSDFEVGGNFHKDMKAKGLLPSEPFASGIYKDIFAGSRIFAESFKSLTLGYDLQAPVQLDIPLDGDVRLTGNLCNLYTKNDGTRQVLHFLVNDSPKYHIAAWLHHLAANAHGINAETIMLVKKDSKDISSFIFHILDKSLAFNELNKLSAIFREGLTYPVPFFPKTSSTFVNNLEKGEAIALSKAAGAYEPPEYSKGARGESEDCYIKYCFSESFFAADEYASNVDDFMGRSKAILNPMIKVRKPYEKPASAKEPAATAPKDTEAKPKSKKTMAKSSSSKGVK